ncbi:unnamed protein product, partial [Urochloa humidicola]
DGHGSSGRGLENPRRPLPSSGAGEGEKGRDAPACLATERERERDERDGAGHFNSLNALAKGPRETWSMLVWFRVFDRVVLEPHSQIYFSFDFWLRNESEECKNEGC